MQKIYEDNIKEHGTLTCYLCLKPVEFGSDSIDHKTPVSKGGTNNPVNLGVTHMHCNKKKANFTVQEYAERSVCYR